MTRGQRRVLVTAAVLIALAVLFPPAYSRDYGFRFIFLWGSFDGRVDATMVIAELIAIALLAGIGWLLCRDNGRP